MSSNSPNAYNNCREYQFQQRNRRFFLDILRAIATALQPALHRRDNRIKNINTKCKFSRRFHTRRDKVESQHVVDAERLQLNDDTVMGVFAIRITKHNNNFRNDRSIQLNPLSRPPFTCLMTCVAFRAACDVAANQTAARSTIDSICLCGDHHHQQHRCNKIKSSIQHRSKNRSIEVVMRFTGRNAACATRTLQRRRLLQTIVVVCREYERVSFRFDRSC